VSVVTSDGAILMSHAYDGMDLDWASYALLASNYLDRPVVACEPGCSDVHLLGPGVLFNESKKSILWRWSPDLLSDLNDVSSDLNFRVASTCGENTTSRVLKHGMEVRSEGHPSLSIFDVIEKPVIEKRSGTGVVLHFNHWDRWHFPLRELGYTVISSFWNERSRDPLEEVRDRLIQIASCERIISTTVAGLGISNACGVPYLYSRDATRPITDRVDDVSYDCLPFMEFFSFLKKEEPLIVDISDIAKSPMNKLEGEMFENPVQLDPQADSIFTLPRALERYRLNFEQDI
jgi:hypothetical protein